VTLTPGTFVLLEKTVRKKLQATYNRTIYKIVKRFPRAAEIVAVTGKPETSLVHIKFLKPLANSDILKELSPSLRLSFGGYIPKEFFTQPGSTPFELEKNPPAPAKRNTPRKSKRQRGLNPDIFDNVSVLSYRDDDTMSINNSTSTVSSRLSVSQYTASENESSDQGSSDSNIIPPEAVEHDEVRYNVRRVNDEQVNVAGNKRQPVTALQRLTTKLALDMTRSGASGTEFATPTGENLYDARDTFHSGSSPSLRSPDRRQGTFFILKKTDTNIQGLKQSTPEDVARRLTLDESPITDRQITIGDESLGSNSYASNRTLTEESPRHYNRPLPDIPVQNYQQATRQNESPDNTYDRIAEGHSPLPFAVQPNIVSALRRGERLRKQTNRYTPPPISKKKGGK
jgi:hypothetical protein